MIIDARGQSCPKPVMMAQEALSKIEEGIVEILVDNYGSSDNLLLFAESSGFYAETSQEGKDWRVKIVKGHACKPESAKTKQKKEEREISDTRKDILMVVASDQLGKEEELGRILMKGFFETMKVTKEAPQTIFFLNAGVQLTTVNDETVPVLKEIEGMGVEIFSCGTCLKYYGLEERLKVGYRGTTNNIIDGMTDRAKTVWIG